VRKADMDHRLARFPSIPICLVIAIRDPRSAIRNFSYRNVLILIPIAVRIF
jgi:hypothetical protein